MDELTIEDKIYISSKRAAEITGYAKDYVGQLCREGRVEARLVGRSWYVLESSIRAHRFGDEAVVEAESSPEAVKSVVAGWESPTYKAEEVTPIAPLTPRKSVNMLDTEAPSKVVQESTPESIEDMQSAWKEWFNTREVALLETPEIVDERAAEEYKADVAEEIVIDAPRQTDPVPLTAVIEDVVPIRRAHVQESRSVQPAGPVSRPTRVPERRVRRRKASYLALRSAMLVGAAVAVFLAFVGTGILDGYLRENGGAYSVLRYLGGTILLIK